MAGRYDITTAQGERLMRGIKFRLRSTGALLDLSGRQLRMQVRPLPGGQLLLDCNTPNGRLVLGDPTTKAVLDVPSSVMAEVAVGHHVWDMWVDDSQMLAGSFVVDPRVTQ